jgi:soluble lytic murein transglycosylase-like protein
MRFVRDNHRALKRLLLSVTLFFSVTTVAAQIYEYEGPDGTKWFTDHQIRERGYTLLRRMGYREVARVCSGLSEEALSGRIANHETAISTNARVQKVDKALVLAVIHVESCFNQHVISRAGAIGLMQLMPDTAKMLGVQNVFDASQNIHGGVKYLKRMLDQFNHDKRLAAAGYNAGPGAVKKYRGIPPYQETQEYVKRVMRYYGVYRDRLASR